MRKKTASEERGLSQKAAAAQSPERHEGGRMKGGQFSSSRLQHSSFFLRGSCVGFLRQETNQQRRQTMRCLTTMLAAVLAFGTTAGQAATATTTSTTTLSPVIGGWGYGGGYRLGYAQPRHDAAAKLRLRGGENHPGRRRVQRQLGPGGDRLRLRGAEEYGKPQGMDGDLLRVAADESGISGGRAARSPPPPIWPAMPKWTGRGDWGPATWTWSRGRSPGRSCFACLSWPQTAAPWSGFSPSGRPPARWTLTSI